jgi:hypothetical protein
MRFPLPVSVITNLNEKNKKLRINKKDWQCFSEKSIKALTDANLIYEKIPEQTLGLTKSTFEHKQAMKENCKSVDYSTFHESVKLYRSEQMKIKVHKWHVESRKRLNENWRWIEFEQCIKSTNLNVIINLEKLKNLEDFWGKQQQFSHYTSLGLYKIINEVLPIFENYLEFTEIELKVKKAGIDKIVRNQINEYLQELVKEISNEKKQLCETILARLEVASAMRDPSFDDVTWFVTRELKSLNVLNQDFQLQLPRRDMVEFFDFFHNFIRQYGNEEQNLRLSKLNWLKNDDNYIVKEEPSYQLIPKSLISLFPENLQFPNNIWPGTSFRFYFLQPYFGLVTQLRFLSEHSESFELKKFIDHPKWRQLTALSEKLSLEENEASKKMPKNIIIRFIKHKKLLFLQGWKKYLNDNRKRVLELKISYAKRVVNQLKTRLEFNLDSELLSSLNFKKDLRILIDNIDQDMLLLQGIDNDCLTSWQSCRDSLERAENFVPSLQPGNNVNMRSNFNHGRIDSKDTISQVTTTTNVNNPANTSDDDSIPAGYLDLLSQSCNSDQNLSDETMGSPFTISSNDSEIVSRFDFILAEDSKKICHNTNAKVSSTEETGNSLNLGEIDTTPKILELVTQQHIETNIPQINTIQDIVKKLISENKINYDNNPDFDNIALKLATLLEVLSSDTVNVIKNDIESLMTPLFLSYLRTWATTPLNKRETCLEKLKVIQDMLLMFAPTFIRDRINERLIELNTKDTFDTFKIKCGSFLYSLDQSKIGLAHLQELDRQLSLRRERLETPALPIGNTVGISPATI